MLGPRGVLLQHSCGLLAPVTLRHTALQHTSRLRLGRSPHTQQCGPSARLRRPAAGESDVQELELDDLDSAEEAIEAGRRLCDKGSYEQAVGFFEKVCLGASRTCFAGAHLTQHLAQALKLKGAGTKRFRSAATLPAKTSAYTSRLMQGVQGQACPADGRGAPGCHVQPGLLLQQNG